MNKTYKIPVSWTVTATMEIEAESIEEAFAIAGDGSLPTETDYLEDSFKIDVEFLSSVNHDADVLKEIDEKKDTV